VQLFFKNIGYKILVISRKIHGNVGHYTSILGIFMQMYICRYFHWNIDYFWEGLYCRSLDNKNQRKEGDVGETTDNKIRTDTQNLIVLCYKELQ
jgi:hypothetical protein